MSHHDPYKNFRFRVKVDGRIVAGFSDAEVHASLAKVQGLHKTPDVTFKRGVIHTQTALDWLSSVSRKDPTSRKNITLVLVDEAGARLAGWKLSSAWITKIEGPAFNASANEIAVESLELANEGLALVDDDDTGKRQS